MMQGGLRRRDDAAMGMTRGGLAACDDPVAYDNPVTREDSAMHADSDSDRDWNAEHPPLLTLRHVTKAFVGKDGSPLEILHDTSLAIGRDERIAIVGPSGSGKSTLLSLLGTLDMPTSGMVAYDGADVASMGERRRSALRAERIGFVFQQFHLIATVSALENVMTGLQYTTLPRRDRLRQAAEALERVGLGERMYQRPSQLSGGEQQRVAIARALAKRPDIIFADEPTGALDTATGHAVVALLLDAAASGASLVVVTHDPNVASRFPRRLHIRDGVVTETVTEAVA